MVCVEPREMPRRLFLQAAAGFACAWVLPFGAARARPDMRSLSLVHTHTGEKLTVDYCRNGEYVGSCLEQVNRFLRDFRSGEVHPIDIGLLDMLHDLQVLADRDATFEVISGFRSSATNAKLRARSAGVAQRSLHMDGRAIDIRITGFATRKLREHALSLQKGGVGYYAGSDFVHVDTGRVRSWTG